jgi:hypothetical protein
MRRRLAVPLLVFLPLQFSWAAVANHCGHDTGGAAEHLPAQPERPQRDALA